MTFNNLLEEYNVPMEVKPMWDTLDLLKFVQQQDMMVEVLSYPGGNGLRLLEKYRHAFTYTVTDDGLCCVFYEGSEDDDFKEWISDSVESIVDSIRRIFLDKSKKL